MICFKSMGCDRNLNRDCCLNRDFQDFQDYCLNRDFQDLRDFQDKRRGGWVGLYAVSKGKRLFFSEP